MESSSASSSLQLISPVFKDGGPIPIQYTCKGQDVNPPLNIFGLPAGTKSLALIVHDPDAPGQDYVHWLLWDIPTATETIPANSVPVGAVQGVNDFGNKNYGGPCPPAGSGTHHYKFELYALDTALSLDANSSRTDLEKAMQGHVLTRTTTTGTFSVD